MQTMPEGVDRRHYLANARMAHGCVRWLWSSRHVLDGALSGCADTIAAVAFGGGLLAGGTWRDPGVVVQQRVVLAGSEPVNRGPRGYSSGGRRHRHGKGLVEQQIAELR